MDTTASRGNAAEAAVLSAFMTRGYRVLVPFGDGHPYDLALDFAGTLIRVQCKMGWHGGGCIRFNARSTDHGNGALSYNGRADVFGVYYPQPFRIAALPV